MVDKIPSEIRKIELDDASFKDTKTVVEHLTFVNFFFGNNGCGKSTIAQAIKSGRGITYAPDKTAANYIHLVYDEHFIDRNFHSYRNMPGVFTMNEVNQAVQEQIDTKHEEQATARKARSIAAEDKQKKEGSRAALEKKFCKDCWDRAEALREEFDKTQDKKRKSKQFTYAVLAATPAEQNMDELRRLYDSAYSDTASHYDEFSAITDTAALDELEGHEILALAIVNSADTDFAKFIRKIGATEWVRQGHEQFSHTAEGQCPYCSQSLLENFEEVFAASFDTQYQENLQKLKNFRESYRNAANVLFVPLAVPDPLYPKIDAKPYQDKLAELKTTIRLNLESIANKIENPASPITLQPTAPILQELSDMIVVFNKLIGENNAVVAAGPKKQHECTEKVFSHIAFLLRDVISSYKKSDSDLETEISARKKEIEAYDTQLTAIRKALKDLSGKTVETESAKEKINLMLRDSGMHGFQLEPHESEAHVYKVVRPDGSIAETLSEGEKNFIAFLYFYYLVQGSETADEDAREKIVVIDDPVSSMDSNSLFIVSTLVKDMIEVCRNNADNENPTTSDNYIKQLFILTHNAFFQQEITYSYVPRYEYVSFFLIRKPYGKSSVRFFDDINPKEPSERINVNPVKNSYAALWEEYNEIRSSVPLMNVIRKILEYYFLQLCGYEGLTLRKVILTDNKHLFVDDNGNFDEEKYQLASSMLSYISAGSVGINDGMYHVDDCMDVRECREIFAMIFKLMKQEQHYTKMCEPYRKREIMEEV